MKKFGYNKMKVLFKYSGITTFLAIIIVLAITNLFKVNPFHLTSWLLALPGWLFLQVLIVLDLSSEYIVDHNGLKRISRLGRNGIQWSEISEVKYEKFRKRLILIDRNNKMFMLSNGIKDYKELYGLVFNYIENEANEVQLPGNLL